MVCFGATSNVSLIPNVGRGGGATKINGGNFDPNPEPLIFEESFDLWDAYLHNIEKEAQEQYEQDMAIKNGIADELESWMADPARGGDFAANSTSAVTGYITYAALASGTVIPVVGQWIMAGVGAACVAWSILRYYKII